MIEKQIKIEFKSEEHKFKVNGKEAPSVSEVIRFISKEIYGDADPDILKKAAEKGTLIHAATEALDKGEEVEIPEEYIGYLQAYSDYHKENIYQYLFTEEQVAYDDEYTYAGIIDRVAIDRQTGEINIIDFKTSSSISKKTLKLYEAQLNLYKMAFEATYLNLPVTALKIVHLKKDGTHKVHNIPINDGLAKACLLINKELTTTKRRMKNGQ